MVAMMGSIYRLESMMTAMAMAAYGSQVKRKANTIATTIRATRTSVRFVLPPSDTFSLVTWDTEEQAENVRLVQARVIFSPLSAFYNAHLMEGPQELRVRHHDDRER